MERSHLAERPAASEKAKLMRYQKYEPRKGALRQSENSSPSILPPTIVVLFTAIVVFDLLRRWSEKPLVGTATMCLFASAAVIIAARLAQLMLSDKFSFALGAFYLFVLIWLVLAPLAQLAEFTSPLGYKVSATLYVNALLSVLAGTISFDIAFSRKLKAVKYAPRLTYIKLSRLTALSIFGLIAVGLALSSAGGPAILFQGRRAFSQAVFGDGSSKASGAIVNAVIIVVPFLTALAWLAVARSRKLSVSGRLWLYLWLLINAIVNNPVAQARFWVATVYVALLAVAMGKIWLRMQRMAVAIFLLLITIIFPFSDVFRYGLDANTFHISDPLNELATKGDFDAFPQLTAAFEFVNIHGFDHGRQTTGALLFFVPRSFWPNKPFDTGTLLGNEARLGNVNLSAPLWAEGYIAAGLLGVVIYLWFFGVFLRRICLVHEKSSLSEAYQCFIGVYAFVILRGSLLQSMGVTVAASLIMFFLSPPEKVKSNSRK